MKLAPVAARVTPPTRRRAIAHAADERADDARRAAGGRRRAATSPGCSSGPWRCAISSCCTASSYEPTSGLLATTAAPRGRGGRRGLLPRQASRRRSGQRDTSSPRSRPRCGRCTDATRSRTARSPPSTSATTPTRRRAIYGQLAGALLRRSRRSPRAGADRASGATRSSRWPTPARSRGDRLAHRRSRAAARRLARRAARGALRAARRRLLGPRGPTAGRAVPRRRDARKRRERSSSAFLDLGVTCFLDLTEEGEGPPRCTRTRAAAQPRSRARRRR